MNRRVRIYLLSILLFITVLYNLTAQKKVNKNSVFSGTAFTGIIEGYSEESPIQLFQVNFEIGFDIGDFLLENSNILKIEPNFNLLLIRDNRFTGKGSRIFHGINIGLDYLFLIYKADIKSGVLYTGLGYEILLKNTVLALEYYVTNKPIRISILSVGIRYKF